MLADVSLTPPALVLNRRQIWRTICGHQMMLVMRCSFFDMTILKVLVYLWAVTR